MIGLAGDDLIRDLENASAGIGLRPIREARRNDFNLIHGGVPLDLVR
jgi:hypothetical protein